MPDRGAPAPHETDLPGIRARTGSVEETRKGYGPGVRAIPKNVA